MFKGLKNNNTKPVEISQDMLANAGITIAAHETENTNTTVNDTTENDVVNFSTSAFSIVQLPNKGWCVVEIAIDPLTNNTGNWTVISEDGTKMGAQERFKISVAKKLFA